MRPLPGCKQNGDKIHARITQGYAAIATDNDEQKAAAISDRLVHSVIPSFRLHAQREPRVS